MFLQPDDFLGMLQELAEDSKREQSQAQTTTPFPQNIGGGDRTDNSISADHRTSAPRVVGLSPAELESLNELISIDHIYVKSQPITSQKGKEGQHKSHAPVRVHGHNGSVISSQQKCNGSIVGSKRKHSNEVGDQTVSLFQPDTPYQPNREVQTLNHDSTDDFTLSPYLSPQSLSSFQSNVSGIADDFISSLSDSDMESPLNLFQDLDFSIIESSFECDAAADLNHSKNNFCMNIKFDETAASDLPESVMTTTKLFDEIYEHYLNIKESSSPDSTALSDSGISSDIDPMSPRLIEESYHDDMWHDTSFADLFPDLQ